jgi:hypothetical protein
MTILFAGGEMGAFIPATAGAHESTNSYDSSFARCNIFADKSSDYAESADFGTGTDLYCHFDMAVRGGGSGSTANARFRWCDGSGTEVIRLTQVYSTNALTLQYYDGAAWQTAGTAITVDMTVRQTIDIHAVVNSASGSLKLYLSGTERIDSGTVDLSSITSLGKVRCYGASVSVLGFGTYMSQVIVADEPTIGWRLTTVPPTGAGSDTAWTGGYAEIDEVTYSDADFVNSATANQVETFSHSTTVPSGYSVRGVAVTARANCGASGPQNLQLAIRSGGTNYFSSSNLLDVGYGAFVNIWETDPATSADFTTSALSTLQYGVKSIT